MSAPLLPGPGEASSWLERELARAEYHPGLLTRLSDWFQRLLDRVGEQSGRLSDLGWPVVLAIAAVVVVILALVLARLQRNPRLADEEHTLFEDRRLPAAQHRALAGAALESGDHDTAVVEAMRALAAGLVERSLVDDVPAATAHEVVAAAQRRFPGLAARLEQGATAFDETRYGGRRADAARAGEMVDLDLTVSRTAPDADRSGSGPVAAVPR